MSAPTSVSYSSKVMDFAGNWIDIPYMKITIPENPILNPNHLQTHQGAKFYLGKPASPKKPEGYKSINSSAILVQK